MLFFNNYISTEGSKGNCDVWLKRKDNTIKYSKLKKKKLSVKLKNREESTPASDIE